MNFYQTCHVRKLVINMKYIIKINVHLSVKYKVSTVDEPSFYLRVIFPRYTMKKFPSGTAVYAIVLHWPGSGILRLGAPKVSSGTVISMLGYPEKFSYSTPTAGGVAIKIPPISLNSIPCDWAWTFKLTGLTN